MRKRLLVTLLPVAIVSLVFGAVQAWAWQKDADSMVGPAKVVTSTLLPAPDAALGDLDTTIAGIADSVVGFDELATDPSDPTSTAHTLFVDDTPTDNDCPPTIYTTIQAAVNASGPNDKIKVCPGTYIEQVQIFTHAHDGLKLESVTPLAAIIQWPTVDTPLTEHALIDVSQADHVAIRGFTLTGPFPFGGCSDPRHEGVLFQNAFNGLVVHNHITLIRNANPLSWGCQEGDAVAIGQRLINQPPPFGLPGSATVDHNLIDKYQKNGVQAVNPGTFANVQRNTITASTEAALQAIIASNGVVVFREAAAVVERNVISENKFTPRPPAFPFGPLSTGIILDEAPAGSSMVDHNQVFDNDFGIESDTQMGLEISHNSVFNNIADAITLCGDVTQGCGPATQIVVRKNDVENNGGSGILLLGADSNLLKSNQVQGNGTAVGDTTDGIRVDANSTNNQILENHMTGNVTHDCHDDSSGSGSGTPPTANTWTNDQGDTQNRDGLCRGATTTP